MKKHTTIISAILFLSISLIQKITAQTVADFENFNLERGESINNASPESVFQSGSIELPNFYDPDFNFWTGWSISADTNTTTPGFTNQFSAIPGEGALGTTNYAVGYIFDPIVIRLQAEIQGKPMIGMHVTNSTYSYLSMRDGDPFAKQFGGETGDDPDFLMLTFRKYSNGQLSTDSIDFYLADYRFEDGSMDYLVADWSYVDLTALGPMDSLSMQLRSSDNGTFGMNTPAYVCIDQVTTDDLQSSSISESRDFDISVSPNPASERLYFKLKEKGLCTITDLNGRTIWTQYLTTGRHEINVSEWPRGMYIVRQNAQEGVKVIIQ